MNNTTKVCKDCGTEIDPKKGRRDRLFCNEECKNSYHNKISFEDEKEAKRINKILKKNRDILKKMAARKDHETISKELLLKSGFDFTYYTHHKITFYKNYQYTFCYDYGYRVNTAKGEEVYKVVKAFEEKESASD